MRNYISSKKYFSDASYQPSVQFTEWSLLQNGISVYRSYILCELYFLVRACFVIMFGYAIIWQQILKRMPLTVAYANRPVTLIWGIIWGALIFGEKVTWNMIAGAAVIFAGIYLVTGEDGEKGGENS